jgi:hypothetical protein
MFMILDDFCLLPAWFCYVIINVRHMKSLMHIANRCAPRKSKSKSRYDRRSVSQSVSLGVKFTLEPVTRCYILSESCCVVSVRRPLWREVRSVSCQSLSSVFSPLSKIQYNYIVHVTCLEYM